MTLRSLLALGLSLALWVSPVMAERQTKLEPKGPSPDGRQRTALVIGNSAYKVGPLRNPVNDARAMGGALAETGFRVIVLEDATQGGMRRAIREFGKQIAGGGIGLFYYAGHGIQVRGRNYLIPVNADIQAEDEIVDQALDANFVLAKMDSANNGLNIVILDACRNNPFHRAFRSMTSGLAQMDAPSGTLIAFATAPGSIAADGDGANGLYTQHLLQQIQSPGVPIEQLFKRVRVGVTRDTRDRQVPWESSSLRGDFYFTAPQKAAASANEAALRQALKESEERAAREREALQANMQKLIQQALERQKKMLEAERAERGEAPQTAPTTASAPATSAPPASTASAAPSAPTGPAGPKGLQAGERWEYEVRDEYAAAKGVKRYVVEVEGFEDENVRDATQGPDRQRHEAVHPAGMYVEGGAQPIPLLSPYMLGVALEGSQREWSRVPVRNVGGCQSQSGRSCEYESATVTVAGKERLPIADSEIEAIKLRTDVQIYCSGCASNPYFVRTAEYWYAPSLKRIVKGRWEGREMILVAHRAGNAVATTGSAAPSVQVASTAPTALALKAGWPKPGDSWVYEGVTKWAPQPIRFEVRVGGVSSEGVFDSVRGGKADLEWVHTPGPYVVGGQLPLPQFSPYMLDVGELTDSRSWSDVPFQRLSAKGLTGAYYPCQAKARVAGSERIKVPAGEFDTVRIDAEVGYCGEARVGNVPPTLELSYWYAPAAKRFVKATQRGVDVEPVDVVLQSYKLN